MAQGTQGRGAQCSCIGYIRLRPALFTNTFTGIRGIEA